MTPLYLLNMRHGIISENLIGQKFGKLTVIERVSSRYNAIRWLCQCECSNQKEIRGSKLRNGRTKSCGCSRTDWLKLRPFEYLYKILVNSNKRLDRKHRKVSLTYEDFLKFTTTKTCHYCNTPITWQMYSPPKGTSYSYHLDRKDNNIGYTKENCVVCCSLCNVIKGKTLTYEEMQLLGTSVSQIHASRKNVAVMP
jgi:hypothetical protein